MAYTALLIVVALVMALTALIKYSRFGAYLVAIRENEDAARALGIDTYKVKVQAMAISGAFGAWPAFSISSSGSSLTAMSFTAPRSPSRR